MTTTGDDPASDQAVPRGEDVPTTEMPVQAASDLPPVPESNGPLATEAGAPLAAGLTPGIGETGSKGVPASELSDEDLEHQGTQVHQTRNWVFLHGTAEQFQTHTERMFELEQEYLRRHPMRTWQGTEAGDRPGDERDYLARFAATPEGRMHKLEAHHVARELGLRPERVAALHRQDPPLLGTDGDFRVLTDPGRSWLQNQS
ncbi:MAG: hypothetical protein H0X18_03095 [Geodermatophilaceae bacterium]|nr:hypothetical protein [Geodermatophilaceae bacterium]